ncbi:hypothetical protein F2Q68_00031814 [Brassica cretica]|uniref:Uncharacterized protein n=1 Tax=Brassica cretica TaxID=69181 RepID=A0A8S9GCT8_BRACR|nr:hypothetical protein F2Q68_00031814 [Brassica cretica]
MSVGVLISIIGDIARIHVDLLDSVVLKAFAGGGGLSECPLSTGDFSLGFNLFGQGAHELILFFRPFFVGGEHLFEFLERRGFAGALAADMFAAGVWRSVPLPPLRGVCTLSVSSVDMSG